MLKNDIIQLLDTNKEGIKNSFNIGEEEVTRIREFLNKGHKSFRTVIDDISVSDLNDRGKMTLCCLIGYINGTLKTKLFK